MSKKGYLDYAVVEYRVEHLSARKYKLKRAAISAHGNEKRLIWKKVYKKREEENSLWKKLHSDRRVAQRKGKWDYNYERVIEN